MDFSLFGYTFYYLSYQNIASWNIDDIPQRTQISPRTLFRNFPHTFSAYQLPFLPKATSWQRFSVLSDAKWLFLLSPCLSQIPGFSLNQVLLTGVTAWWALEHGHEMQCGFRTGHWKAQTQKCNIWKGTATTGISPRQVPSSVDGDSNQLVAFQCGQVSNLNLSCNYKIFSLRLYQKLLTDSLKKLILSPSETKDHGKYFLLKGSIFA